MTRFCGEWHVCVQASLIFGDYVQQTCRQRGALLLRLVRSLIMKRQNFGSNSALHCAHPLMYWICHGGSNSLSSEIKRSRADERRVGAAKSREMPRSNSADTSILIKMGCGHTSWLLLVLMRPPALVHSQSARLPGNQPPANGRQFAGIWQRRASIIKIAFTEETTRALYWNVWQWI